MKIVLNDIRIERTVLGKIQLQMQFRIEGTDKTTAWQMPFDIGEDFERVTRDIHEFAQMIRDGIQRINGAELNKFMDQLKRDCATKSKDAG